MKNPITLWLTLMLFALPGIEARADNWQTLNPATEPVASYGHTMVKMAGTIYLYGASSISQEVVPQALPVLGNLWQWNESQKEWAKKKPASMPPDRHSHSAAVSSRTGTEKMYVFFGADDSGGVLSDIWSYNPTTNIWNKEPSVGTAPPARKEHTSTALTDGRVLVFGGLTAGGGIDEDVWIYDPSHGTWEKKSPFPDMFRYGQSAVATGGKVYVFGGMGPEDVSDKMWVYDSNTEQWELKSPSPSSSSSKQRLGTLASGRLHPAMALWDNMIWVFGGEDRNGTEMKDTWEYNISDNTWTQRKDMPIALSWQGAVALESQTSVTVLLFGGKSNSIAQGKTYSYSPDIPPPFGTPNIGNTINGLQILSGIKNLNIKIEADVNQNGRIDSAETIFSLQQRQ
jgi:N-acetylneuraminic acid mutarotase